VLVCTIKSGEKPKIEICRSLVHDKPLCNKNDQLIALLFYVALELGVPCFELNDINGLADLVERKFWPNEKGRKPLERCQSGHSSYKYSMTLLRS
jgi:hypothetical protein